MNSPIPTRPIVGLLLAAGASRRYEGNKLLQRMSADEGDPLIVLSARHLLSAVDETMALIPPGQPALREALAGLPLSVAEVAQAAEGMGATLAAAVRATAHAAGWVVALADMPMIQTATIARVAAALRAGAPLAAPVYQGQRGHPVGFSARFFAELAALGGDTGAQALLRAYAEELLLLECADAGVVFDIDTPEDLARLV